MSNKPKELSSVTDEEYEKTAHEIKDIYFLFRECMIVNFGYEIELEKMMSIRTGLLKFLVDIQISVDSVHEEPNEEKAIRRLIGMYKKALILHTKKDKKN